MDDLYRPAGISSALEDARGCAGYTDRFPARSEQPGRHQNRVGGDGAAGPSRLSSASIDLATSLLRREQRSQVGVPLNQRISKRNLHAEGLRQISPTLQRCTAPMFSLYPIETAEGRLSGPEA